jgi:hypothetical protein
VVFAPGPAQAEYLLPEHDPAYRDLLHHCIANLDAFSCIRLAWLVERRIR